MELAANYRPNVVLLRWPGFDGVEWCRRLKQQQHGVQPAILLRIPAEEWNSGALAHHDHSPEAPVDACLADPSGDTALLEMVYCMLRLYAARREAGEATAQANALREELQTCHEDSEKLVRRIRHDIETPLRAMNTFVELVAASHELQESERTYLGHVLNTTDRARLVLDDLVVWAQSARHNPQSWRLIQLRGVVAAALHHLNGSLQEAGAAIQIDDTLPQIRGGFGSLQLLLQVLVANAIQYRKLPTGVNISIGAKQGPADEWVVSVADDGIGIDPSHCESIFAPLQRLHGNEIPGSGMGLAICKRIVAAHGGRIWVESTPGSGSTFFFTLPAVGEAHEHRATA
jgi:light-regulated signal transduction histidine kinase (bacteriophytochrome)